MADDGSPASWSVFHKGTGKTYGPYVNRTRARNLSDKLDNQWGSYITSVRPNAPLPTKGIDPVDTVGDSGNDDIGQKRGGRVNRQSVEGKKPRRRLDRKSKD